MWFKPNGELITPSGDRREHGDLCGVTVGKHALIGANRLSLAMSRSWARALRRLSLSLQRDTRAELGVYELRRRLEDHGKLAVTLGGQESQLVTQRRD